MSTIGPLLVLSKLLTNQYNETLWNPMGSQWLTVTVCVLCTVSAQRHGRALLCSSGNHRVALTCSVHGFMALLLQGLLGCSSSHQKNQGWLQQAARLANDRHASQGQLEHLRVWYPPLGDTQYTSHAYKVQKEAISGNKAKVYFVKCT